MKVASKIVGIVFLSLLLAYFSGAVYATTVSFYVDSLNGGYGKWTPSNSWVGEFPIVIGTYQGLGVWTDTQSTFAYCISGGTLSAGSNNNYTATLASPPDNATWRSIAYILTWYNPPASNSSGVTNAVAIWDLLGVDASGYGLSPSELALGSSLASAVSGKDVARVGDQFSWIAPTTGTDINVAANAGDTITFTVKLTSASDVARPNVRIIFNATVTPDNTTLASPYWSPSEAFTDSNGEASVNVTVPSNLQIGKGIDVQASTMGVWPQLYLDVKDQTAYAQDLVGIDTTYGLTVQTNVSVIAHISNVAPSNVVPEVPWGTIIASALMAGALATYITVPRLNRKPKQTKL